MGNYGNIIQGDSYKKDGLALHHSPLSEMQQGLTSNPPLYILETLIRGIGQK
jgi:hypothetical protein